MKTTGVIYDWMLQDYLDLKRAFDGDGSQKVELRIMGQDGYWISHIDLPPGSMKLDEETQKHYNPELLYSNPAPYKTVVRRVGFFVDDVLKLIVDTPEVVVEEDFQVAFQPGELTVGVSF